MDGQSPSFPILNPDEYKWRQSPTNPSIWTRRTCGVEAIAGMKESNDLGAHELFLDVVIRSGIDGLTVNVLANAAVETLAKMRLQFPHVALTWSWDDDGRCLLDYCVPKDYENARSWAKQHVKALCAIETYPDICREIEKRRHEDSLERGTPAMTIHIVAPVSSETDSLSDGEIRLIFHANHIPFDSTGLSATAGIFIKKLAEELSSDPLVSPSLLWEHNANNLVPAAIDALSPRQQLSGPAFNDSFATQMSGLARTQNSWGLPVKPARTLRPQFHTSFYTFTANDSDCLLRAVKSCLASGVTITHLTHAAIYLAVLKHNPPLQSDGLVFGFPCPIDGRRFLRPEYAAGKKPFFGPCQSFASIIISDVKADAEVMSNPTKQKILDIIARVANDVKEQYAEHMRLSCTLSAALSITEILANIKPSLEPAGGMSSPLFTSHGILDKHMPPHIEVATSRGSEKPLMVDDAFFWANQLQPSLHIRLSSFRGRCRLSVSWNGAFFTQEEAEGFLNDIVEHMLLFAESSLMQKWV